jgi:hypothetical protein
LDEHSRKDKLLELIEFERDVERKLFADLGDEMRVHGDWDRWAPKDVVAHTTSWKSYLLGQLQALDGVIFAAGVETEVANRRTFDRNAARSWEEICGESETVTGQIIASVASLDEQTLFDPARFPELEGGTLAARILGNAYDHPLYHLMPLYVAHGAAPRVVEIQEEAARKRIELDPSPASRALALYNLACYQALAGNASRAIELLRESLPLREDLIAFSRGDPDLDSLRELPAYRALYE